MSRLGVLYALKEDELNKLRSLPHDERYDYMLEEIEETLLETPRGCELDKAWEGIQYCLGGGEWNEENFRAADKRIGQRRLERLRDIIKNQAAQKILELRIKPTAPNKQRTD